MSTYGQHPHPLDLSNEAAQSITKAEELIDKARDYDTEGDGDFASLLAAHAGVAAQIAQAEATRALVSEVHDLRVALQSRHNTAATVSFGKTSAAELFGWGSHE